MDEASKSTPYNSLSRSVKPEVISTIGGQIDILPTIANLMDLMRRMLWEKIF